MYVLRNVQRELLISTIENEYDVFYNNGKQSITYSCSTHRFTTDNAKK